MSPEYKQWLDDLFRATKEVDSSLFPIYSHMNVSGVDQYWVHTSLWRIQKHSLKELLEAWEDWYVRETGRGTGSKPPVVPSQA